METASTLAVGTSVWLHTGVASEPFELSEVVSVAEDVEIRSCEPGKASGTQRVPVTRLSPANKEVTEDNVILFNLSEASLLANLLALPRLVHRYGESRTCAIGLLLLGLPQAMVTAMAAMTMPMARAMVRAGQLRPLCKVRASRKKFG